MTRVISTSFVIMNETTKIQYYLQSRAGSVVEAQTKDDTNLLKEMFLLNCYQRALKVNVQKFPNDES